MADHAQEPSWQPVILFAVALPRDGSSFATALVRAILEQPPVDAPPRGRSKQARENAAKWRARQFFFFRCFTNAYQLDDPDIALAFEGISKHLLPPRNVTDAEVLAACGEAIVPYLVNQDHFKAPERAACVRALGLIGGSRAYASLETYLEDTTDKVNGELIRLVDNPLTIPNVKKRIQQSGEVPHWARGKISDLSPLSILTNLTNLYLYGTRPSGIDKFKAAVPNCRVWGA